MVSGRPWSLARQRINRGSAQDRRHGSDDFFKRTLGLLIFNPSSSSSSTATHEADQQTEDHHHRCHCERRWCLNLERLQQTRIFPSNASGQAARGWWFDSIDRSRKEPHDVKRMINCHSRTKRNTQNNQIINSSCISYLLSLFVLI